MEIDIVDRVLAIAVDEIDEAAADPLDRRDVELHRPDLAVHRLGAQRNRALIGFGGVGDAKGDRAHRRAVQSGKGLSKALGFGIEDEVDVALLVEGHVFRAMPRRRHKPHPLEERAERLWIGAGIFDELKPIGAHRVVPQIAPLGCCRHHHLPPLNPI